MLTPFSQRYNSGDAQRPAGEAAMAFGGQVVLAHDMTGSPFRPGSRQRPAPGTLAPARQSPTATECPLRTPSATR